MGELMGDEERESANWVEEDYELMEYLMGWRSPVETETNTLIPGHRAQVTSNRYAFNSKMEFLL
jgi:hypothetical protein